MKTCRYPECDCGIQGCGLPIPKKGDNDVRPTSLELNVGEITDAWMKQLLALRLGVNVIFQKWRSKMIKALVPFPERKERMILWICIQSSNKYNLKGGVMLVAESSKARAIRTFKASEWYEKGAGAVKAYEAVSGFGGFI